MPCDSPLTNAPKSVRSCESTATQTSSIVRVEPLRSRTSARARDVVHGTPPVVHGIPPSVLCDLRRTSWLVSCGCELGLTLA